MDERLLIDGPWEQGFLLRVPLALRSKSNFRRYNTRQKSGSWEDAREFERSLGLLVLSNRPHGWDIGDAARDLASRPVVVAAIAARSRIDVANYSKSVLDACQGVLYVSDASVLGVTALGERGASSAMALGFARLPAGSSALDVGQALTGLTAEMASFFLAGSPSPGSAL
jgi:hypothetical protein